MKISEIKAARAGENLRFTCNALLKSAQKRTAKNGSDFMVAEFADKTGSLTIMCFGDSLAFALLSGSQSGDIFKLSGMADFYNGKLSPKLDSIEKLSSDEAAEIMNELIETSANDPDKMKAELFEIIGRIPNKNLRETVRFALADVGEVFFTSTAAIKMHHAYAHGLLEHTLNLARLAEKLLALYPFVNPSLALAGAILHDIGKTVEYSQGLVADKTRLGILQGHVVLGFKIVRKAALKCKLNEDLTERLEHIILSHQGELQWGAAAIAATPEAVFVSMLDYLDARMGAVASALNTQSENEFSDLVPALQSRVLLTPPQDDFKLYIATSNAHKIKEFKEMFELENMPFQIFGANDLGGMPPHEENGKTFEENARIKAEALKTIAPADAFVLADDSGLCVDALNGAPGIFSARYANVSGANADKANNEKLLHELKNIPPEKRGAHFACSLALICPNGELMSFEGRVDGFINEGEKGLNGFGYDPLFELPERGITTAELSSEEKNALSHRGIALKNLAAALKANL